jgi:aminoglycoside 3-N-acetyltransferase I
MHEPFSIVPLSAAEVDAYRGMLALFAEAFADAATYTARQPDDRYVRSLLGDPGFLALVAVSGKTVIGGLAGYVLRKFEQPRSEFYIYDLAVAEAHRRRGVATALIRELQRVCAQRDIHVVFVQADYGDDAAVALYTRLGTREDVMHFDIDPQPGTA